MDIIATKQAVAYARKWAVDDDKGPLLLEFVTYRYGGHSYVFLFALCSFWLLLRSFTGFFWSFLPSFSSLLLLLAPPHASPTYQLSSFFVSTLTPHHSSPPLRCPFLCSLGTSFASRFPCTFLSNTCPFYRCPFLIPVSISPFSPLYSFAFFCLLSIFLRPILLLPISSPFGVPFSTLWHLLSSHTNLT